MLTHEYYKLKIFNRLQYALNAYHEVFMDYVVLMKSHILSSDSGDIPSILFHHLERIFQEMEAAYKILYSATDSMYDEISKIEIKDSASIADKPYSITLGELEEDRRLKNLSKMKQFMDACKEELKKLQTIKRSEQIVIEHKVVQSNTETNQ